MASYSSELKSHFKNFNLGKLQGLKIKIFLNGAAPKKPAD